MIEPVELHFRWRPQSHDPGDEMLIEAAINGRADALVTYNTGDFAAIKDPVLSPPALLRKMKR